MIAEEMPDDNQTEGVDNYAIVQFVEAAIDRDFDRQRAAFAPVWEAQNEMARLLVSLSTGALVLSVTFVQFTGESGSMRATWLLVTAWILFAGAVLLGALRQGWATAARRFHWDVERNRAALRADLLALQTDAAALIEEIIVRHQAEPLEKAGKASKVHDNLMIGMFYSFAFGLFSLLVFAWRNLPSA